MTGPLLAEFRQPGELRDAVNLIKESRHHPLDAFSPYPIEGLDGLLGLPSAPVRMVMLVGGLVTAAFAFALQWYSAVVNYPINSGGRPLNSWQVFFLVPFEVGVFAAALCGVAAFLWLCRLPRLNHPLFEIPGFERATQDRFFLLAAAGPDDESTFDLRHLLEQSGAVVVTEVR